MNILVVGLGSMGKRRIRILKTYFKEMNIFGIDLNEERRLFCERKYEISVSSSIDRLFLIENIDIVFICTSPLSHDKLIKKCLENKKHVFSEINLVSNGYEDNIALAKKNDVALFLSSTPLYRKEICYIIEQMKQCKCAVNYNYHVGQYLPDWHPWENFKDFFIGDNRTNGCRELFAIEFPWIIEAFGKIIEIKLISGKNTKLNINFKDNYLLLLMHESGHKGMMAVDVMCREPVRKLEVFGEDIFIEWCGTENSLRYKNLKKGEMENIQLYNVIDKINGYSKNIIENPYIEEVKDFFALIQKGSIPKYSFEKDFYTLDLIDEIEKR